MDIRNDTLRYEMLSTELRRLTMSQNISYAYIDADSGKVVVVYETQTPAYIARRYHVEPEPFADGFQVRPLWSLDTYGHIQWIPPES